MTTFEPCPPWKFPGSSVASRRSNAWLLPPGKSSHATLSYSYTTWIVSTMFFSSITITCRPISLENANHSRQ